MDNNIRKLINPQIRRLMLRKKTGIGITLLILLTATLCMVGCGVSQDEYDLVVSNLAQTEQELEANKTQLGEIEDELANTQSELEAANTRPAGIQKELADAQSELEAANTRLASLQKELADAQSGLASIAGTIWTGMESDGDYYEFFFMSDGSLHYKSPTGFWTVATWKQDGNTIYMEFNDKYAEREGTIQGKRMEGEGWNVTGKRWTWYAEQS